MSRFTHPDYEYVRSLGRGGAGTVHLCRHKLLGRLEVVKVPSSELLRRPGMKERFLKEVQAAAALQHPNVVTAFGVVQTRDGLALTMEFVDGPDLHELVAGKGTLSVDRACRYMVQVCRGLAAANARGMVHRDIKPANLIRATVDGAGVIKILDFGLAQVRTEEADSRLTSTGDVLGTPDFMPPEQARDPGAADIRSDLYALGGTLYFLLTGKTPFPRPGLLAILDAHRYDEPPDVRHVRPDVPAWLANVINKLLAKKPADRFQCPEDLANALSAGVSGPGTGEKIKLPRPQEGPPPLPASKSNRAPNHAAQPPSKRVPAAARTYQLDAAAFEQATKPKPPKRASAKSKDAPPEWLMPAILGGAGLLAVAAVLVFVLAQVTRGDPQEVAAKPPPEAVAPPEPVNKTIRPAEPPAEVVGELPTEWKDLNFRPLFVGSRTGWKEAGQAGTWEVKGGVLSGRGGQGSSLLVYEPATFANVHLRARVRLANHGSVGDLGVRCQSDGSVGGYLAHASVDAADEAKTGSLVTDDQPLAKHVVSPVRPGEWFQLDVMAAGDRVTVKVNDRTTAAYTDPARRYGSGLVAVRACAAAVVEFSHIAVRDISPPPPSAMDGDPPPLTGRHQRQRKEFTFKYEPGRGDGTLQDCQLVSREGVFPAGFEPLAGHIRPTAVARKSEWALTMPDAIPAEGYRLFVFKQGSNTVPLLLSAKQAAELPRGLWAAQLRVVVNGTESVVTSISKTGR